MGHFRILEFFIFSKVFPLKDNILDDSNHLGSFNPFLFDIFFLSEIEMISWGSNNIHEGFIEENEIQLSLNFFRVSFVKTLSLIKKYFTWVYKYKDSYCRHFWSLPFQSIIFQGEDNNCRYLHCLRRYLLWFGWRIWFSEWQGRIDRVTWDRWWSWQWRQ